MFEALTSLKAKEVFFFFLFLFFRHFDTQDLKMILSLVPDAYDLSWQTNESTENMDLELYITFPEDSQTSLARGGIKPKHFQSPSKRSGKGVPKSKISVRKNSNFIKKQRKSLKIE